MPKKRKVSIASAAVLAMTGLVLFVFQPFFPELLSGEEKSTKAQTDKKENRHPASDKERAPQGLASDATRPLKLMSWNIRNLSKKRDDEGLQIIAKLVHDSDVLSILEVRDEEILQKLCLDLRRKYNKDYVYELSAPVGRGAKEHYAFLYNRRRVHLVVPGKVCKDLQDIFIREPFYATFRCGQFDFTLLAVHILWGTNVAERRKEIVQLASVFRKLQAQDPKENDLILVGDFNRSPADDLAFGALKSIPTMRALFQEPEKTMIGDTNLYDNIWFESKFVREFRKEKGIIAFDKSEFANDRQAALKLVSDHRPVWALFNIEGPDDD